MIGSGYIPSELRMVKKDNGDWKTVDNNGKEHTEGVDPSSISLSKELDIESASWMVHGVYSMESGKSFHGKFPSSIYNQYWDIHGEELEGRLLLW